VWGQWCNAVAHQVYSAHGIEYKVDFQCTRLIATRK